MQNGPDMVAVLFALSGVAMYLATSKVQPKYFFGTRLDTMIPLLRVFILPYLFFFPYFIATVTILWGTPQLNPFLIAAGFAGWAAGIIWYVLPAAMKRPKIIKNDMLSGLIALVYRLDAQANTFPSAHVFYALICSYFLSVAHPEFMTLFAALGALIVLSTLFVRQHQLLDVAGGAAWAVTAISVAHSLWA